MALGALLAPTCLASCNTILGYDEGHLADHGPDAGSGAGAGGAAAGSASTDRGGSWYA